MIVRLLRSILAGAFFLAYGLLALLFAPVLALPIWRPRAFRALIRFYYRAFVACGRLTGLFAVETAAADRARLASLHGAIVVMNHISLIDIVVILAHIPDATAIAKPAVLRNPFLSIVAKRMFIVNDGDVSSLIATACTHLAQGTNVVIFPQGTRGGATFHRGAAHLALTSRVAVQPVRIDYAPPVLTKGQPWWDVGAHTIRISLNVRDAIVPSPPDSHAAARALTAQIADALAAHNSAELSPCKQHADFDRIPRK